MRPSVSFRNPITEDTPGAIHEEKCSVPEERESLETVVPRVPRRDLQLAARQIHHDRTDRAEAEWAQRGIYPSKTMQFITGS